MRRACFALDEQLEGIRPKIPLDGIGTGKKVGAALSIKQERVKRMVLDKKLLKAVLDLSTNGTSMDLHFGRSRLSVRSPETCEAMQGLAVLLAGPAGTLSGDFALDRGLFTGLLISTGSTGTGTSSAFEKSEPLAWESATASNGCGPHKGSTCTPGTALIESSSSASCWKVGHLPQLSASSEISGASWARANLHPLLLVGAPLMLWLLFCDCSKDPTLWDTPTQLPPMGVPRERTVFRATSLLSSFLKNLCWRFF